MPWQVIIVAFEHEHQRDHAGSTRHALAANRDAKLKYKPELLLPIASAVVVSKHEEWAVACY
jgi:hypothetical protein